MTILASDYAQTWRSEAAVQMQKKVYISCTANNILLVSMVLYMQVCSYDIINAHFECSPETAIGAGNIDDLMYIRDTLHFTRAKIRDIMLHELCVE